MDRDDPPKGSLDRENRDTEGPGPKGYQRGNSAGRVSKKSETWGEIKKLANEGLGVYVGCRWGESGSEGRKRTGQGGLGKLQDSNLSEREGAKGLAKKQGVSNPWGPRDQCA